MSPLTSVATKKYRNDMRVSHLLQKLDLPHRRYINPVLKAAQFDFLQRNALLCFLVCCFIDNGIGTGTKLAVLLVSTLLVAVGNMLSVKALLSCHLLPAHFCRYCKIGFFWKLCKFSSILN